jgi:fructose/tagatose bisphosphate aldolase
MSNNNLLTVSVKCSSMAQMASDAGRYAMAAAVGNAHWINQTQEQIRNLKTYIAEVEALIDSHAQSDEAF